MDSTKNSNANVSTESGASGADADAIASAAKEKKDDNNNRYAMVQFICASASYRIIRLTIELFLVEYTTSIGYSAAVAGLIFLVYNMADSCAALFSLWRPNMWFGSLRRGWCFLAISVGCMTAGFIFLFYSTSIPVMVVAAMVCGLGTATWFVHYLTLMSKGFQASSSGLSKIRHIFECLGFLLPSIVLAVTMQTESDLGHILKTSTLTLAGISLVFFFVSSPQIARISADCEPNAQLSQSVWDAAKSFATSSVVKYFFLEALMLALSSMWFASLSICTQRYFGLDSTFLWLAAIGVPIGGMFSSVFGMKGWFTHNDDRRVVLNGTLTLAAIFTVMILAR